MNLENRKRQAYRTNSAPDGGAGVTVREFGMDMYTLL